MLTRYDDVVRVLRSNVSRDVEANATIDENDPIGDASPPRAAARAPRRSSTSTHPITRGCGAWFEGVHTERHRPPAPADRGDGRQRLDGASERGRDRARRRARVPGAVPGDLRTARHADRSRRRAARAGARRSRSSLEPGATHGRSRQRRGGGHAADPLPHRRSSKTDASTRRRPAVGAAGGRGRRRHLEPGRADLVRGAAVRRRPRDDGQPDRQRNAGAAATPRSTRAAGATTRPSTASPSTSCCVSTDPVQHTVRVPMEPISFNGANGEPSSPSRATRC